MAWEKDGQDWEDQEHDAIESDGCLEALIYLLIAIVLLVVGFTAC